MHCFSGMSDDSQSVNNTLQFNENTESNHQQKMWMLAIVSIIMTAATGMKNVAKSGL
jgi:hypothetical protein